MQLDVLESLVLQSNDVLVAGEGTIVPCLNLSGCCVRAAVVQLPLWLFLFLLCSATILVL